MKHKFKYKSWMRDVLFILLLSPFHMLSMIYGLNYSHDIPIQIIGFIVAYLSLLRIPSMLILVYYAYSTRNQLTATIAGVLMWWWSYVPMFWAMHEEAEKTLFIALPDSIVLGILGYATAARMSKYIIAILIIIQIITAFETLFIMISREFYHLVYF